MKRALGWTVASTSLMIGMALAANSSRSPAPPGHADYMKHCANCHGPTLRGAFAPALTGAAFKARWAAKPWPALRKYIIETMPPSDPRGLPADAYDRIALYISQSNGLKIPATAAAGETKRSAPPPSGTDQVQIESGGVGTAMVNKDATYEATMRRRSDRIKAMQSVTQAMIEKPPAGDWLSYRHDSLGAGFSPLAEITATNVDRLQFGWAMALPAGTNGITPLAHDGMLFVNSSGTVLALDGVNGEILWTFARPAEAPTMGPPVTQPRGMAIYQDRLIVPTSDNHILALDMRTGELVWDQSISGMRESLRITAAPLVVKDRIIQGMSGCAGVGEPGGCFVVALDAASGKEIWRFHTVAKTGEPGGDSWNGAPDDKRFGGAIWAAPSYDPETGLIYIGTSQTYNIATLMGPHGERSPANAGLYTDSTLALDPETGKLVWYYQHLDREVWDLDWAFERTIGTVTVKDQPRRAVMTVGKIGILDMLDARTGQYLGSYDIGYQYLVTKIDPVTGRKTTNPAAEPDPARPNQICPFATGVRNWPGTSFAPESQMLYVPLTKTCMEFSWNKGQGWDITYAPRTRPDNDGSLGGLVAIDLASLKPRWEARLRAPTASATLATAGGLVFAGGRDRNLRAFSAQDGTVLWQVRLDNIPSASPITYLADGTQFVAITTGGGNPNDATVRTLTPEIEPASKGTTLWVFRLNMKDGRAD
nr:PQQ-binding-like beta-propeller repeat protein [Sphingomonas sp. CDS-1]